MWAINISLLRSEHPMSQATPDSKSKTRIESDSMGEIEVPADRYDPFKLLELMQQYGCA